MSIDDDKMMGKQFQMTREMKIKMKVTEDDLLGIAGTKLYSLRYTPGL